MGVYNLTMYPRVKNKLKKRLFTFFQRSLWSYFSFSGWGKGNYWMNIFFSFKRKFKNFVKPSKLSHEYTLKISLANRGRLPV